MTITPDQLHMLRHMLGINTPYDDEPRPYRNYAAVSPSDPRFIELERLGLVKLARRAGADSELDFYLCTDEGRAIAMRSHRDIRHSRGARRYHRYLKMTDAFPGLTFGEYLKSKELQQGRSL